MKHRFRISGAILVCALLWSSSHAVPARAADDAVITADKALVTAFEKGDNSALKKYLDPDFSWIDTDGVMTSGSDALALGMKPKLGEGNDVQVREFKIGDNIIWLHLNSGNIYVGRVWVKRASGWKLLHTTEIMKHGRDEEINVRPAFAIPCVNPCQTVPFHPVDKIQAEVLKQWQEQVSSREQLIRHTDDDQVMVTTYDGETPPRKVRLTGPGQPSSGPAIGSPPVLWMRMWTIDPQTVVMLACHPSYGGKAYWSSRAFHFQNGLWQMMESYHNTIQQGPVMTEVQGK